MEANKIIITGGATRIGAAIAEKLSGPGKKIVIHFNKSKSKPEKIKSIPFLWSHWFCPRIKKPDHMIPRRDPKMVWVDWAMLLGWLALLAGGATQRA